MFLINKSAEWHQITLFGVITHTLHYVMCYVAAYVILKGSHTQGNIQLE